MNSEGEIRELAPGQLAALDEIPLTYAQADSLRKLPKAERKAFYNQHVRENAMKAQLKKRPKKRR